MMHLPAWALVLFRLSGIFLSAPLFGGSVIPTRFKVLLAAALSLCIYPILVGMGRADIVGAAGASLFGVLNGELSLWVLPGVIAGELVIGLAIGFAATIPLIGMQLGGRIVDQQLGLGVAGLLNPDADEQGGAIGEFYYLLALAVFLLLGGHRLVLGALLNSFINVPLGGGLPADGAVGLLVGLLESAFALSLKVAAPLLCLVFLETVAMGFVARTVPQLNILSIGFPLRIIVGMGLLIGSLAVQGDVLVGAMRNMLENVAAFVAALGR
jgi:flagellar biosynthesis protein FliR